MDAVRVGRVLRLLRRRRGLRQIDVARSAGVSQSLISTVERGHLDALSLRALRRIFAVVDARVEPQVSWRGAGLDRLLDHRHAQLTGSMAGRLRARRWAVDVEVTFSEYGERGSIDILATRPDLGVALVVEIKTELVSVEEMLRRLDVKSRLAASIVASRMGRRPTVVGRLLVVLEGATARRHVASHAAVLGASLPRRSGEVRRWLRRPEGSMSGLVFSSLTNPRSARPAVARSMAAEAGDFSSFTATADDRGNSPRLGQPLTSGSAR